jgi:hypothetical protein
MHNTPMIQTLMDLTKWACHSLKIEKIQHNLLQLTTMTNGTGMQAQTSRLIGRLLAKVILKPLKMLSKMEQIKLQCNLVHQAIFNHTMSW